MQMIEQITFTFDGVTHEIPVYQGRRGKYYVIDEFKYDYRFPIKWAVDHKSLVVNSEQILGSGPKNCESCRQYGAIHGVHAFYCFNCTDLIYEGTRGGCGHYIGKYVSESIFEDVFPYLTGVSKKEIGDN